MRKINVPTREEVSTANQEIFDTLKNNLGFIPNIYATYAHSENALGRYMAFASGKTSISKKEKELINLVVSQVNQCEYCLAAHTALAKMNGYTDNQIIEIRHGNATFDAKLHALAVFTKKIVSNRGEVADNELEAFFDAGYTKENLIDLIVAIGEKTITNLLHKITNVPIDFPEAPKLSASFAQ